MDRSALPLKCMRKNSSAVQLDMSDADYVGGVSSHIDMDENETRYPYGMTEIVTSDYTALTKINVPIDDVIFGGEPIVDLCVWVESASSVYQTSLSMILCPDDPPVLYKGYGDGAGLVNGWNQLVYTGWSKDTGGGSGFDWNSAMKCMQLRIASSGAGKTAKIRIADPVLRFRENAIGRVIFCFDNGFHSNHEIALPIMEEVGIKGSMFVVSEQLDTNQYTGTHLVPMFSMDDLDDLYAAGWCLANHTKDHTYLDEVNAPTVQANLDIIAPCQDFLSDNGFTRGLKHFIQPNDDNTENTFVALEQLGIKTNQRGNWGYAPYFNTQPADMFSLTSINGALDTVENTCAAMDAAVAAGAPFFIHFHDIVESDAQNMDITTANFQLLIDHVVENNIKTATMDEWYAAFMGNPRYRSLPIGRAIL